MLLTKEQKEEREDVLKMIDLFLIISQNTRELTPEEYVFVEKYFEKHGLKYIRG